MDYSNRTYKKQNLYCGHNCEQPTYGQKVKYAPATTKHSFSDEKGKQWIQSIVEKFFYYDRAVKPTVLTALNDLATQ